jgi:aspartate-semialdehyde dehydrogenase
VQNVEHFDFTGWDIALFAAGSAPTKIYAPKAASQGCVVIDNSSLYRMDPDVPLIVPEVNPDAIDGYTARNIIANPNCSTAQMVVALKPLHDKAKIKRVVVATYQSVSGAGKEGMDELFEQSRAIFVGDQVEPKKFTKQIAFNVIPHRQLPRRWLDQGRVEDGGRDQEDPRSQGQGRRDLRARAGVHRPLRSDQPRIRGRNLGCRSPGHPARGARRDAGRQARERWLRHPDRMRGRLCDLCVARARGSTVDNGLALWCVSDNLRKGAALNAVQIAELLGRRHLKKG